MLNYISQLDDIEAEESGEVPDRDFNQQLSDLDVEDASVADASPIDDHDPGNAQLALVRAAAPAGNEFNNCHSMMARIPSTEVHE